MDNGVRLIDANKLKQGIEILCKDERNPLNMTAIAYFALLELVDTTPTIEAEPVNGWISVDDRLPESKTWVMVYIKYSSPVFEIERGIHKMGDIKKVFYDGFCKDKSFCGFGTITHWQPLPEPPKGE